MPEDIVDLRPGKENSAPQAGFEEVAGDLMRKYGAKTESEFLGVADRSDYDEYMKRYQQAEEDRIASLLDEIDRRDAARRETVQKTVAGNDRASEAVAAVMTPGADIAEGGDLSDVAERYPPRRGCITRTFPALWMRPARGSRFGRGETLKKERQRVRDALYQEIEKPWLTAKAEYTAAVRKKIGNVAQQLEKLGIEAGSKESAAVQWIGEGQRQQKNELGSLHNGRSQARFSGQLGKDRKSRTNGPGSVRRLCGGNQRRTSEDLSRHRGKGESGRGAA